MTVVSLGAYFALRGYSVHDVEVFNLRTSLALSQTQEDLANIRKRLRELESRNRDLESSIEILELYNAQLTEHVAQLKPLIEPQDRDLHGVSSLMPADSLVPATDAQIKYPAMQVAEPDYAD